MNYGAIEVGLVIHGPELIDAGNIGDLLNVLRALGPLHAQAGGTMARVAILDKQLTSIDTSTKMHTSEALNFLSDKDVLVLANCGKTLETGIVFGEIVSSRVRRSVIQVERLGTTDGRLILWQGFDGDRSDHVHHVAKHLSTRLPLEFEQRQKKAMSSRSTAHIVARHIAGAKRGEPVLIEGIVVGTVVGDEVVITSEGNKIVNVSGVATKAHGLQKIGEIDLGAAYIKTGFLRAHNKACGQETLRPARPLKRGSIIFVNHGAESTFESVNEWTVCAITVGDDTTLICGDILSRMGIPIVGITDGDGDGIYAGMCKADGSVILRLSKASDDNVGLALEQSGILNGENYTLSDVVTIVTGFLRRSGVVFVATDGKAERRRGGVEVCNPDI
jgi:hypothetical protein